MSFTPNKFLHSDPNIYLRDQQHAARLFVDDQFRLAPKHKFLFHVAFNINSSACSDQELLQRHRNEINMLVKNVDLPTFTITTDTTNQYNRKKNIQTKHDFGEIIITFHDDNMSLINKLWQNYYSYYYADSKTAKTPSSFNRNATKNFNYINGTFGLDNGSNQPFFNDITIFQMARHEYVSYKLINPIITSWGHDKLSYSETGTTALTMKLKYEAVAYNNGKVDSGDVTGFALEHYDLTPSPLSGEGNILSASPNFTSNVNNGNNINTIIEQIANYQNTKELPINGISGVINNTTINTNGLNGIAIPLTKTNSNVIKATPYNSGRT